MSDRYQSIYDFYNHTSIKGINYLLKVFRNSQGQKQYTKLTSLERNTMSKILNKYNTASDLVR